MRRMFLVLVAAALLAAMAAPAALAINKACTTATCSGTNGADKLRERSGNGSTDNISGKGGKDTLRAEHYRSDTYKHLRLRSAAFGYYLTFSDFLIILCSAPTLPGGADH